MAGMTSQLSFHFLSLAPGLKILKALSCNGISPLWANLVLRDFL
jgi:hypothetical protein